MDSIAWQKEENRLLAQSLVGAAGGVVQCVVPAQLTSACMHELCIISREFDSGSNGADHETRLGFKLVAYCGGTEL